MSVLDSFTEEMLQSELPKRVILERLTHGLEVEKPPQFAIPAPKYTFETNLHGFRYDYQNQTVTISYKYRGGCRQCGSLLFAVKEGNRRPQMAVRNGSPDRGAVSKAD